MKTSPSTQLREHARVLRLMYLLVASGLGRLTALEIVSNHFPEFSKLLLSVRKRTEEGSWKVGVQEFDRSTFEYFVSALLAPPTWRSEEPSLEEGLWRATSLSERTSQLFKSGASGHQIAGVQFFCLIGDLIALNCPILQAIWCASKAFLNADQTQSLMGTIEQGETFTDGLRKIPTHFSDTDFVLVEIGEQTGAMAKMCWEIAKIRERHLLLRAQSPFLIPLSTKEMVEGQELLHDSLSLWTLQAGGLSITRSFDVLSGRSNTRDEVFALIHKKLKAGSTCTEAMSSTPGFPPYVIELVKVAEAEGKLKEMWGRIADYLRWDLFGLEMPFMPSAVPA